MNDDLKARLTAWYNRRIQAGWYLSAALIGGWITATLAYLPDIMQFVVDHFDYFGSFVFPTMEPETKAAMLAIYVTFIAPPLRAWIQQRMREKSLKQQAEAGAIVIPAPEAPPEGP